MRAVSQSFLSKLPAITTGAALAVQVFWLWKFHDRAFPLNWSPADAVLMIVAAVSTFVLIAQCLPLQNVLAVAGMVGAFGLGLERILSFATGWPIPIWAILVLWPVGLIAARLFTLHALRPWRSYPNFGIGLIGAAGLLAGAFVTVFIGLFQHNRPLPWFVWQISIRSTAAILILVLCVPAFIRKSPTPMPSGFWAFVNWLALNMLPVLVAVLQNRLEWVGCLLLVNAGIAAVSWVGKFRTAE